METTRPGTFMTGNYDCLKTFLIILALVLLPLSMPGCASEQSSQQLAWPRLTRETRPWTRWWWMGSIVNEKDLTDQMEQYRKAGLGGLEITPIYGVKGYEDRFIDYLSPAWMEMLVHTLREADRQAMLDAGYTFDFVSDRQIAGVKFAGDSLRTGNVSYKTIVLPECRFIPLETLEKLAGLAQKGATIVVHNKLPADVPGWGNLVERQDAFQKLLARLDFAKAGDSDIRGAQIGRGKFLVGDNLEQLLSAAGAKREPMAEEKLRFVRRRHAAGRFYFIVNTTGEPLDGWIGLRDNPKSVAIFDPMFEKNGPAAIRTSADGDSEIYLQLAPGESCILKTSGAAISGPSYNYTKTVGESREIKGVWSVKFIEGGPEVPPDVQTGQLVFWTDYGG